MADVLLLLDMLTDRSLRRQRIFLDRENPLELYDDQQLISRYRFPKGSIIMLVEKLSPNLERSIFSSHGLPVLKQVLAALRFYAMGSYQKDSGEVVGISQSSMSRCIRDVSRALISRSSEFISFTQKLEDRKIGFYQLSRMPNVIGAVDGSHVHIEMRSKAEEPLYVCKKGGHSINVQIVCDHKMYILDIVAQWPGTTHDSFIWKSCALRQRFSENPPDGWLLEDSGYGIEPWLLVPFRSNHNFTDAEKKYQAAFVKTRRIVENTIGLWKIVFRCLKNNELLYEPAKCCEIIAACAVLHNIRRSLKLLEDERFQADFEDETENDENNLDLNDTSLQRAGIRVRNDLISNYFSTF